MTFSQEVKSWLDNLVARKEKPYMFKVEREVTLVGSSGNSHRMDFTIARKDFTVEDGKVRENMIDEILVEVKAYGERGSTRATSYRVLLQLAFAELADFPKELKKFVIVPHKVKRARASAFDFDRYFASIGATLVDFSSPTERSALEQAVANLSY